MNMKLNYINRTFEEKCFAAAIIVSSGSVGDASFLVFFAFSVVVLKKNDTNDLNFEVP